jgi:hypothetical protein
MYKTIRFDYNTAATSCHKIYIMNHSVWPISFHKLVPKCRVSPTTDGIVTVQGGQINDE